MTLTSQVLPFLCSAALMATPLLACAAYTTHPEAIAFAKEMLDKHGFDAETLQQILSRATHEQRVISLIRPPASPSARSWQRYRGNLVSAQRLTNGLRFWAQYAPILNAAAERYGVPAEVIVSIIGIESNYGGYTGNFETVSALATLAFDYPPRAPLFKRELEELLLLAREQGRDPFSYSGSYAGAFGYPQFLPSSVRAYAVDFDGDGSVDLESSPMDAIGSVANYLAIHGWQKGEPVAQRVVLPSGMDGAPLVAAGIEPTLNRETLVAQGIQSWDGNLLSHQEATLVDLPTPGQTTEYWLGYRNFYVITRYNKSSFYAMAVYQLAESLRQQFTQP